MYIYIYIPRIIIEFSVNPETFVSIWNLAVLRTPILSNPSLFIVNFDASKTEQINGEPTIYAR